VEEGVATGGGGDESGEICGGVKYVDEVLGVGAVGVGVFMGGV
jgi:hypothetical protein